MTLKGQLEWLERMKVRRQDVSLEDGQMRVEADSEAVLLTTIHRSKGLEYPFVLCPFLWDTEGQPQKTFLIYRRRSKARTPSSISVHLEPRLLPEGSEPTRLARLERQREAARLLYVALTRAKHQVTVVWLRTKECPASALGHLLLGGDSEEFGEGDWEVAERGGLERLQSAEVRVDRIDDAVPQTRAQVGFSRDPGLNRPAPLQRVVRATVQTASYSSLTSTSLVHADVGRDVDAVVARVRSASNEAPVHAIELPLLDLPSGTRTGEALHTILESIDFREFAAERSTVDVGGVLERFGIDGARFEAKVRRAIRGVLQVELQPKQPEMKLSNVGPEQRRCELQFLMKVSALSGERMAAALSTEITGVGGDYDRDVARLRFDSVTGYLRGFIDLVFQAGEQFYVVDYKSNNMGDTPGCYGREHLCEEMRRHHYPVQASIYATAVDRWLRSAKRGYDYERHFGGVFYLFLRGMVPELGSESGVFFHRPSMDSLARFDAMLRGETP